MRDSQTWINYAGALAFTGNSLLSPMNHTKTMGLDLEFWSQFPTFESDNVALACVACARYAQRAQELEEEGGDAVQQASYEFTKLFIGPPRPAAAPWETFYSAPEGAEVSVGFGTTTFEMQQLLHEAGLQVQNENNQYADHIGIELLYASVLCVRVAEGAALEADLREYLAAHPLAWIDKLESAIDAAIPDSYPAVIVHLAHALMESV